MSEHTPIPWQAGFPDGSGLTRVMTATKYERTMPGIRVEGTPTSVTLTRDRRVPDTIYLTETMICSMDGESADEAEREANAAFIVRCVNAHDALVEALLPFAHGDLRQYEKLPDDTVLILCVSGMERRPDIAEARWLRLGDLRRAAALATKETPDA